MYLSAQSAAELKTLADNAYSDATAFNNARFVFDADGHTTAPYSGGTQPTYYYNQVINHLNNMMQYTGETTYIDQMFTVLTKIRNIATINNSSNVSKFNSSYRYYDNKFDWPSAGVVQDLWEQHGIRSAFEFFYWLDTYAADYPQYQSQNQENFQWFKTHILDKWIGRGYNTIFEVNTWMTSHMVFISYFASKMVTGSDKTTYENIYKAYMGDGITMTSLYNSGNYDSSDNFVNQVFTDPNHGGYSWAGNWGATGLAGDINHQSAEVELMFKMYLNGDYYTDTDMDKLVITIKAVLDAADAAGFPTYNEIPFRSDAIYRSSEDNRNFGMVPGWTLLTGYDNSLKPYFNRMDTKTVKDGHYLPVFYSDRMLGSARIEGTIDKPLFGGSTVITDPILPDTEIFNKKITLTRSLLSRRN